MEKTERAGVRRIADLLTTVLSRGYLTSPDPESGAMDLGALKGSLEALGQEDAAELLRVVAEEFDALEQVYPYQTRESSSAHAETVLAVMDRQRQRISKRFGNNAQAAIRAFGALPLAEGETVADRYRQLQWSAKQASNFGTERRANHLVCVRAAMEHLAQVGGYPDAARMEFALEADLVSEATDPAAGWDVGEYRVSLAVEGMETAIVVERGGKRLRTTPKTVRSDAAYAEARELQERLRSQGRRLRFGLLEQLVAEGRPIAADEVAALLRLPAGREMIPSLVWRTAEGVAGLLETGEHGQHLRLRGLDGSAALVVGDLYAAHCATWIWWCRWQPSVPPTGRSPPSRLPHAESCWRRSPRIWGWHRSESTARSPASKASARSTACTSAAARSTSNPADIRVLFRTRRPPSRVRGCSCRSRRRT